MEARRELFSSKQPDARRLLDEGVLTLSWLAGCVHMHAVSRILCVKQVRKPLAYDEPKISVVEAAIREWV